MLVKLQALLQKFKSLPAGRQAHSKVLIVAVFSVFFITLIITTLQYRVNQSQQNTDVQPTPTLRVPVSGRDYVEGQISVKFKDGITNQQINQALAKYNARIKSTIPGINVKVVQVPIGQENVIREQLVKDGIVKYADLDYVGHSQVSTNDPDFAKQYGLSNTGQAVRGQAGTPNADVKIKSAWDVSRGNGIKLAVLDSGLDTTHPEFASKIAIQKIFITNSIDDQFGHGTHVAGIASAVTDNTKGISGACPSCSLLIGKVLDDAGNGPYSVIAEGIVWAADNGAKVINLSLGGYDQDNALKDSVAYAWGKGSVIVAAAGNDNSTRKFYPSGYPPTVAVASTNNKDTKSSFSNHGTWVMVAAPGSDIYSTFPTHSYAIQSLKGTALNYDYISGTSMASPLVSGVAALIWSTMPAGTTNQAVVDKLYATADPITGTGNFWQKGRINAAAAVGASGSATPTLSPGPTASPGATITPTAPVPTFVCGGSPNSVCNPTTPVTPGPTNGTNPTITQGPDITITPTTDPTITPAPDNDCLDPRSTPERIREWVNGFIKKITNYIQLVLGNPQDTNRPAPPQPCIIR